MYESLRQPLVLSFWHVTDERKMTDFEDCLLGMFKFKKHWDSPVGT